MRHCAACRFGACRSRTAGRGASVDGRWAGSYGSSPSGRAGIWDQAGDAGAGRWSAAGRRTSRGHGADGIRPRSSRWWPSCSRQRLRCWLRCSPRGSAGQSQSPVAGTRAAATFTARPDRPLGPDDVAAWRCGSERLTDCLIPHREQVGARPVELAAALGTSPRCLGHDVRTFCLQAKAVVGRPAAIVHHLVE